MKALAVVIALVACSSSKQGLKPLPDEQYLAEGVPAADHRWSPDELTSASEALARIARAHPYGLPPHAHPLFARIVEPPPADDPAAPVANRVKAHFDRYNALNALSKLYTLDVFTPGREQIDILGALLVESVAFDKLGDEFLASFPPDDPKLANRRAGFVALHDGVGEMLVGGVMIAEDARMPDDDRRAMIAHVAAALPALYPKIPAARQTALREHLDKLASSTSGALHDDAAKLLPLAR